jgi:hypothetical protein
MDFSPLTIQELRNLAIINNLDLAGIGKRKREIIEFFERLDCNEENPLFIFKESFEKLTIPEGLQGCFAVFPNTIEENDEFEEESILERPKKRRKRKNHQRNDTMEVDETKTEEEPRITSLLNKMEKVLEENKNMKEELKEESFRRQAINLQMKEQLEKQKQMMDTLQERLFQREEKEIKVKLDLAKNYLGDNSNFNVTIMRFMGNFGLKLLKVAPTSPDTSFKEIEQQLSLLLAALDKAIQGDYKIALKILKKDSSFEAGLDNVMKKLRKETIQEAQYKSINIKTGNSSTNEIQCFKCLGFGHRADVCPSGTKSKNKQARKRFRENKFSRKPVENKPSFNSSL